ncbi:MAG: hypothetical protein ACREX3_19725 [Gammaproteobacteria bacterium]
MRKVVEISPPRSLLDLTSNCRFPLYTSPVSPVPIIRNEELILLRAEINIGAGNVVAAAEGIDFIRVNSGGLAERGDLTAANSSTSC